MTMTGIKTFDSTIHLTNEWLDEVMAEAALDSRQRAYHGLRAVLHTLRDRLTIDEAAHLSAQLPMMVRGFYYEGWRPTENPTKERTKEAFLDHVRRGLQTDPDLDAEQITRATFAVLDRHITEGEADEVKKMLPQEIRELWP